MAADVDSIVSLAATGASTQDIATAHGMTVAEVRKVMDEEAARCFGGDELRRQWLLEAHRLRVLGQKYFQKAMMGDGNESAAVIYIKSSERLATLTGMNAPIGHAVHVMHATAPQVQRTSTEKLRGILDNVLHISSRERELINRLQYDGEDTPEIRDELNRLRAERDKPPLQPGELPD